MYVIGTAGHVDHGKSTLIQALTGTHPDRLKEEREREMTIDLGFAWLALPGSGEVGIVDVPGHRDFIENMLAGIGGIDAALFVVAADEGVMPQTREHLAILNLLQIQGGVVALTKIDMVEDEWLELVIEDLRQFFKGTVMDGAPILPVSARTGQGIPELAEAIQACLATRQARPDLGRPRLPIDRVFTVAGFGTVVTGTLSDGRLSIGEEVEILPQGMTGRVRGLQTHKKKEDSAEPGSRTAVNISGVALDQVQRGNIVAHPRDYQPTRRLDVQIQLLPDIIQPLRHNTEVKLFIGTTETVSRVRVLGKEELIPGESGWLQIETEVPVVVVRGDRYILRRPSPGETLGGGSVIDPHPKGRHKRFAEQIIPSLEMMAQGTPADILLQAALALGAGTLKEIIARSHLDASQAEEATRELLRQNLIFSLEQRSAEDDEELSATDVLRMPDTNELMISNNMWEQATARIVQEIRAYHLQYPLRSGMPREELKSRLKNLPAFSAKLFNATLSKLARQKKIVEGGPSVRMPGFTIQFSPIQEQKNQRLLKQFSSTPFSPPSVKESQAEIGEESFQALVETGQLIIVAPEVVFRVQDYQQMVAKIRQLIGQHGQISAAMVRDHFNTSRKYALAILEHLDRNGVTVREGDFRRLQ